VSDGIAPGHISLSYYETDAPIPADIGEFLKGGEQSKLTPLIVSVARELSRGTRRARVLNAVAYIEENFQFNDRKAQIAFTRTGASLFQTRELVDCSDVALAQAVLFRSLDVPARLVVTASVDWMLEYQQNDLLMYVPRGHVFAEVYLENSWHLLDPAFGYMYSGYDPNQLSYPRNYFFGLRGQDYWDMGITDIKGVNQFFKTMAEAFKQGQYSPPGYPKFDISIVN
jgi:transglutaminase-like putative cysteine protease